MSTLTAPGGASMLDSEVRMTTLESGGLPLFLQPLDVSLRDEPTAFREWLVQNREPLEELLLEHGALVFRGFAIRETSDFSRLFEHYPDTGFGYRGGAAPRANWLPAYSNPPKFRQKMCSSSTRKCLTCRTRQPRSHSFVAYPPSLAGKR